MEKSTTRVSVTGKVARALVVALLSLVGLSVIGVGPAAAASQPTVTSMSLGASQPCPGGTTGLSGSAQAATAITVCGSSFGAAGNSTTQVLVNGVALPAASVTVITGTRLNATIPFATGPTPTVNIQVLNPSDTTPTSSCTTAACQFTYTWAAAPTVTSIAPTFGPATGGTAVTITGTNLAGASSVDFGSTASPSVTINSATSITATSPSGSGAVDVTVTTPYNGGTSSATSTADLFNYLVAPTVAAVSAVSNPPTGPTGGGTQVQVAGTGFGNVTGVKFGSTAATSFLVNSFNSITAIAPAGTGAVDVTVTTGLGTSPTSAADKFTYNSTLTLVNGYGAYDSGTSTSTGTTANATIVQKFNALTLAVGGGTIDPTTLQVVSQPASGSVTASGGFLSYTPAQAAPTSVTVGGVTTWTYNTTTTGNQTATIALCNQGSTYPSAGCATATVTYLQAGSGFYMGQQLSALGGAVKVSVVIDTGSGIVAPASAASGSTFTTVTAPPMALIPATNSGFTVTSAGLYQAMTPVPAGVSLVPGSLHVSGGDAASSGKYSVNLCTAAMGYVAGECTAQMTGNYKTTYPYIQTSLNVGTTIPGGAQLTLPTVTADWLVTGSSGTIDSTETEFATSTNVVTIGSLLLDAYPSDLASYNNQGQNAPVPNYAAPDPRWSVAITGGGPTAPVITSANAATFTAGTAGTFTVTSSGNPAPTFGETGTLPTGVSFDSTTGVLSGTPAAGTGGTYPLTITASNGVSPDASQSFTLTVDEAPTITSANATTFKVGTAGTFTATATGFPAPTFSKSGTLPAGVTFVGGVLAGTPAAGTGGSYPITITAANGTLPNATQSFTLTVGQAPAITSAASTTFKVGTAGSFTATATGFPAPTFSETGSLPSGVTFVGGVLSGTPAAGTGGTYPISITATNAVTPDATQSFTLTVDQAPTITSANATGFTVGVAGTFTVTASGFPASTFSETGALPGGVTFVNGVLSGTPIIGSTGSYPLTITAANGTLPNATQNFTLTVSTVPTAPNITSANATTFKVGTAGSFTVTASGNPSPTFSETGALPSGVTFVNGLLSGTPAAGTGGTYPLSITAANGVSPDATQSFTLTVDQAPLITSANATTFAVGAAGTFTVTASGNPSPTFSETGALPSGVTFVNGLLSGTPASGTGGAYPITITAANGVTPNATQNFTLTVTAPPTAPSITSGASTTFTVGTAGSFQVTATGYPIPTYSETGALPGGVSLSGAGLLSGTPAAGSGGTYPITITATNGVSPDATQSFTLTVHQAPAITSANSTNFVEGTAGSFTVTATGSPAPTFSEAGTLPSGVTFVAGVLSGTATVSGNFPITITATNGVTPDATQNFTLHVLTTPGAPTFTGLTPGDGSVAVSWSPGSTGGSPILSYQVASEPSSAGCTVNAPATTCTVTGLTNGTPYQFEVRALNAQGPGTPSAPSAFVTPSSNGPVKGYWMVTSNGAVLTNGAAVNYGSPAGLKLSAPIVAMTPTPDRKGYWIVGADGGVFNYGDAGFYGSAGNVHLAKPIVGMAATSDGKGYWLVASDGGVFAYGDAAFVGSMGGKPLNAPVVGIAGNGTGGYLLVAADGGIFAFGSASFHGSAGNLHLVAPIVGISALANGSGYYLAAADGGVFAYNAPFVGSAHGVATTPIVGISAGAAGGYALAGKSGAVYAYPAANYYGNQVGSGASGAVVSVAS